MLYPFICLDRATGASIAVSTLSTQRLGVAVVLAHNRMEARALCKRFKYHYVSNTFSGSVQTGSSVCASIFSQFGSTATLTAFSAALIVLNPFSTPNRLKVKPVTVTSADMAAAAAADEVVQEWAQSPGPVFELSFKSITP